jgi:ubiquitin
MEQQRRRLATVDAEIERKTEEHRRRRAAEMAALNAKGGPRMLEMPVLVRTPSLEELQADDDELDVPAEAATVVPGTPPGMAQLLTRISTKRNDENVAPSDEDTPAATTCDVADTTSPERYEDDDAKAGGEDAKVEDEDAKAEDERADVTPADASFDQPTELAADAPDEVALMARACYAQSRVHTLRGRWEEADAAREMGSVYARMCAAPAEAVSEKNFREEGNETLLEKRARETDAVETTGKAAKVSDGMSGRVEVAAEA